MASTPPKVAASPDVREWMRWAEENFATAAGDAATREVRVGAAQRATERAAAQAGQAAIVANDTAQQRNFPTPSGAVVASLYDVDYWTDVKNGVKSVFGNTGTSSMINVNPSASGLILAPTADADAWVDITAIRPVPKTGKVYAAKSQLSGNLAITWYLPDTTSDGQSYLKSQGYTIVPNGIYEFSIPYGSYSVALTREAGLSSVFVAEVSVFEVFGDSGLNISPGGVSVEDPTTGDKTTEINPGLPLLAAPVAPTLTSSVGSVSVVWTGALTDGPAPAHLSYVYAEEATASGGPWVRVGQSLNLNARDIITRPPVGSTRWYRLTAVDTSGRAGTPSAASSITVEGVSIPDLSGDIGDVIDTVDGLNKIFFEAEDNPPTAHANGDLWFVVDPSTTLVTAVNSWNGIAWVPYRLVADSVLVPGSIGTITLADGVITAPKIGAGEINADHISVGSIGVDQLTPNIGSGIDISVNPAVESIQDGLEAQALRFRFDSNGLHIGEPDTDDELRLTPGRIEMIQAGQIPSYWEAQTFYVERMIVDAANIANHRWENAGPGHSILRPL